jgi:hypothetical protein
MVSVLPKGKYMTVDIRGTLDAAYESAWDVPSTTADGPSAGYTIKGDHTLGYVGQQTAAFLQLTPANTHRFVNDWLSEWEQRGFTAEHTVDQVQKDQTDGWVWDCLCSRMGEYVKYHTNQQLADFIVVNLIRVTSKNVLKGFEALTERSTDDDARQRLNAAKEAVEVLQRGELSELLHELAHPS